MPIRKKEHWERRKDWMVISTYGTILQQGDQGLVIVDNEHHVPLLTISEISDDNVVELFIDYHKKAAFINHRPESLDHDPDYDEIHGFASDIELMVSQDDLG